MNKWLILSTLLATTSIAIAESTKPFVINGVKVLAPADWSAKFTVIYDGRGEKIGEALSDYPGTGEQFIAERREGYSDDDDDAKFVSSGSSKVGAKNIHWVCRQTSWEDANGNFGTWFVRSFWVPVSTRHVSFNFYSRKSCAENMDALLRVLSSAQPVR